MWRALPAQVWLLTLIQAFAMSAGAMMALIGGVLGAQLAPRLELATLPLAAMIVGTALSVLPVTRLMAHYGRKKIFVVMAACMCIAALLAAWAARLESLWLFVVATVLLGVAIAGFQQVRFAAMELCSTDLAPKAASTVMLGGLVAAILGPELVTLGEHLLDARFAGSFMLMALLGLICCGLFLCVSNTYTKQPAVQSDSGEIARLMAQPDFIIAVSASVIGYGLMSFIMTATPVHMHVMSTHSLEHTKWVIQSHIIAMFAPSFISGWLMTRLGVKRVIGLGIGAYLVTIASALSGNALEHYWVALVSLGIGWNFLFIGGTVLLGQINQGEHRLGVQGRHEFTVFGAQAVASLSAGVVLHLMGWRGMMWLCLALVLGHIALLCWQRVRIANAVQAESR